MDSRKANLRLTENITFQVPNTGSISILLHVSKYLEKMISQLMFWIFYLLNKTGKSR